MLEELLKVGMENKGVKPRDARVIALAFTKLIEALTEVEDHGEKTQDAERLKPSAVPQNGGKLAP